jgi:hypothetical protein
MRCSAWPAQPRPARRDAATRSCSSSMRAADFKATDAALGNVVRSNGARRRTTQSPRASVSPWPQTTARICRFRSVRVTDRRAWRFGTTAPHQMASIAPESSTTCSSLVGTPVDNSARLRSAAGKPGPSATWCTAKCWVFACARVRSTRSKSADRKRGRITIRPDRRVRGAIDADVNPAGSVRSDSQALAALGTAGVDHSPATAGLHANQKAVGAGAADFRSLVCAFHDLLNNACLKNPGPGCGPGCLGFGKPTITPKTPFSVNDLRRGFWLCGVSSQRQQAVDNRCFMPP